MSKKESRRIVPLAVVAIAGFVVLVAFEVLIIGGAVGIKSSTVARIAPWAYEPFLRLVGEHPESAALRGSVGDQKEEGTGVPSGMASVAGFNPDALVIELDVQPEEGGDVVPEAVVTDDTSSNAVPAGSSITNPVPEDPEDVVPVG